MAIKYLRTVLILGVLICSACAGSNPIAPSPATHSGPLPIVLSGQSNALPDHLGDPLRASYSPGVTVVAQGSTPIRAWAPDGPLWQQLEPTLHAPMRAFVWWQGESDAAEGSTHYLSDLTDLVARVRAANGNPALLVVVVKVLPYVNTGIVRDVEEAYAASDPHSVIVRLDDLATDGGNHLQMPEYPIAAERVVAALR